MEPRVPHSLRRWGHVREGAEVHNKTGTMMRKGVDIRRKPRWPRRLLDPNLTVISDTEDMDAAGESDDSDGWDDNSGDIDKPDSLLAKETHKWVDEGDAADGNTIVDLTTAQDENGPIHEQEGSKENVLTTSKAAEYDTFEWIREQELERTVPDNDSIIRERASANVTSIETLYETDLSDDEGDEVSLASQDTIVRFQHAQANIDDNGEENKSTIFEDTDDILSFVSLRKSETEDEDPMVIERDDFDVDSTLGKAVRPSLAEHTSLAFLRDGDGMEDLVRS